MPRSHAVQCSMCRSHLSTSAGRKRLSDWLWQMNGVRSAASSMIQRWSISKAVRKTAFSSLAQQSRCCTEPSCSRIDCQTCVVSAPLLASSLAR